MAITITKQPAEISFSKNPMFFEFQSDRALIDLGSQFVGFLYFWNSGDAGYTGPAIDDVLVLKVYGVVETFIFKEVADGTDNLLPTKQTSESVYAWHLRLLESFYKNFTIKSRYELSITTVIEYGEFDVVMGNTANYIKFQSYDQDLKANIELGNESVSGAGLVPAKAARPVGYEINLRVYAELWVEVENKSTKLLSASMPVGKDGLATWDVSLPLNAQLEFLENFKENFRQSNFWFAKSVTYYISYTEVFGANQMVGEYNKTVNKRVVYGGLPINQYPNTLEQALKYDNKYSWLIPGTLKAFKIIPDQPLWLSWLNLSDQSNGFQLQTKINYENGTSLTIRGLAIDIPKYQKVTFSVSASNLGISSHYPEYKILSHEVSLVNNNQPVSEVVSYFHDERKLPYCSIFLYRNSFGAYETLMNIGKKSVGYEIEKSNTKFIDSKDFRLMNGSDRDFDIKLNKNYKINTGYRSKAEIERFRDFFISDEKYMIIDGQYWPVNITNSKIEEQMDGDNLFALSFDIVTQHLEENWG